MKKAAHTFKDNFWSKKRVEKELTIHEIAELIDCGEKSVGMWFSGQQMPNDKAVADLCALFDVDPIEGMREFRNAHKKWDAENKKTVKYSSRKKSKAKRFNESKISSVEDAIKALYGVLSCEEFILVYDNIKGDNAEYFNLSALLYGKVDYETYANIIKHIGSKDERNEAGV